MPPAAAADTAAPVTTSNAVASYVSMAAITLSATDAGSGVATTYYKLDGGAQVAGTSVVTSALGAHTLQFWSVDKAGNIETAKTVNFTVTAPVPAATTAPATASPTGPDTALPDHPALGSCRSGRPRRRRRRRG